jgi:hypothetical protein
MVPWNCQRGLLGLCLRALNTAQHRYHDVTQQCRDQCECVHFEDYYHDAIPKSQVVSYLSAKGAYVRNILRMHAPYRGRDSSHL